LTLPGKNNTFILTMTVTDFISSESDNSMRLMDKNYNEQTARYIQLVSNMEEKYAKDFVELPKVVFCGNQSAGKSSLLEAIANVQVM